MPVAKNSQSGFSLIELLVAVVILAVGLLGLAQLQVTAIKANAQSNAVTTSNALVRKVVEEIAAMSSTDPIFSTDTTGALWDWVDEDEIDDGEITVPGAGVYNVTYDVVTDYQTVEFLSQITVHVQSATAVANVLGNRTRSVDAITYKRAN